jgi:riboflavin kinase
MDELIFALLKHGAYSRPIRITTTELGKMLKMSQQNISHKLRQLEDEKMIERSGSGIILTKKAKDQIRILYGEMKTVLEGEKLEIDGKIISGLGEGKYYLSLEGYRKQIKEKLGYCPFPGTLNIEIDEKEMWKKQMVLQTEPTIISGFKDKNRAYGDLFAYPCTINSIKCALTVPIRTHHGPEVIEIISRENLKKKLNKDDGDKIKVVF